MTRKTRAKADPIEQEIELAFDPGAFIYDGACFSFVRNLDVVAAKIAALTDSEPARVVTLYETFLACCYEKVDELDDSSGGFGQFAANLYCGWINARQANGADPDETASRLLRWMGYDLYGFCYHLESNAARVLDKAGLTAFVNQIRARYDGAAKAAPQTDGPFKDRPENIRRQWGEALRTLYIVQRNVGAYVSLAEETGLTARDCEVIATLFVARRKPEEALAWVERGDDLDRKTPPGSSAAHDLARLRRRVLAKLGRGNEALAAAWADYRERPSKYAYAELLKFVPRAERNKWHEKAIEAAEGADLGSVIALLLETKELERLADLVRQTEDQALENLSHYTTKPVAKKLDKTHPDLAARVWCAQGLRIVNAKKSKYYDAALSNFESAKCCFERAGLVAEWEKTVSQVRADHHRKIGFMRGFERLVAGTGPRVELSFLDRAKARWNERQQKDNE
jgi:hypothetical protein